MYEPLLLTSREAAVMLGRSVRTLAAWRKKGIGPPWVHFSGIAPIYVRSVLLRWAKTQDDDEQEEGDDIDPATQSGAQRSIAQHSDPL